MTKKWVPHSEYTDLDERIRKSFHTEIFATLALPIIIFQIGWKRKLCCYAYSNSVVIRGFLRWEPIEFCSYIVEVLHTLCSLLTYQNRCLVILPYSYAYRFQFRLKYVYLQNNAIHYAATWLVHISYLLHKQFNRKKRGRNEDARYLPGALWAVCRISKVTCKSTDLIVLHTLSYKFLS